MYEAADASYPHRDSPPLCAPCAVPRVESPVARDIGVKIRDFSVKIRDWTGNQENGKRPEKGDAETKKHSK